MVKIPGSRVSSLTASLVSVKSTTPRPSYEVTAEESKHLKDTLGQEMAGLVFAYISLRLFTLI